jgi:uncharacterized repeat protein (TIGR03803 family)
MALLAAAAQAQTYSVLYKFQGKPDGANPFAGMIQDAMGNLYGTTNAGGTGPCTGGCGTVFKVSKNGHETVLYRFCPGGNPCTDGYDPDAALIQDAMGNLYGTTYYGGGTCSGGCCSSCGVVFKLDTSRNETVLYSFCPGGFPCTDGANPIGGLIQDANGNFYGTTPIGGGSTCRGGLGCGTVFELDTNGKETVLYSFRLVPDGASPNAGVIQDATGYFYGTTELGGVYNKGTVFKLSNTGVETVLHSFRATQYGGGPTGGLTQDGNGNLYGTTLGGGDNNNGQVFKLSNTGKETVLYRFTGKADGGNPYAGVIRDAQGNLYGTAEGGVHHGGMVFKLSKTGKLTVLHSFCRDYPKCADGSAPEAGVIRDAKGNLYGTTFSGGDLSCGKGQGCGVVFKLTP